LVFIGIFGCAAGWHICFDVLDRFLVGKPIGAIAGVDAMKFAGWQRSVAEYSKQFGVEAPGRTPKGRLKSHELILIRRDRPDKTLQRNYSHKSGTTIGGIKIQ
jgi:hypothetical protein